MRRHLLTAAAGLTALAAAILLALLGRAVLATPAAVEHTGRTGAAPTERAAARLLAADRAERPFAIFRAYRRAAAAPAIALSSNTPLRLAALAKRLGTARERSQAHVIVGATFALPAGNGSIGFDAVREAGGGRLLDQALGEFLAAARLDDRNEAAKYDLELLLKAEARKRAASRRQTSSRHRTGEQKHRGRRPERRRRQTRARVPREQRAAGSSGAGGGY